MQADLLALNAAVEAARAGEQGRALPWWRARCAPWPSAAPSAAKEISALMNATVNQIASGAEQMDHAGTTIGSVVDAVQRVSTLVQQISCGRRSSRLGIAQVNEAVTQLADRDPAKRCAGGGVHRFCPSLKSSAHSLGLSVDVFKCLDSESWAGCCIC